MAQGQGLLSHLVRRALALASGTRTLASMSSDVVMCKKAAAGPPKA